MLFYVSCLEQILLKKKNYLCVFLKISHFLIMFLYDTLWL